MVKLKKLKVEKLKKLEIYLIELHTAVKVEVGVEVIQEKN